MTYQIGIDSGGTHIVATAWDNSGKQLAQTTAGPGNILIDGTGTMRNLHRVIEKLTAELDGQACTQILAGIAGSATTGNGDSVAAQLQKDFSIPTAVVNDAELALLNGLEGADGTLVIAGTGSITYGRQNGQFLRVGGWGQLLGDTGSAYQIFALAMKKALAAHDRGEASPLITLCQSLLEANSMPAAVRRFYQLDRAHLAAFAAKIAVAADDGDEAAQAVITESAQALAQEVLVLLDRYDQPTPLKLALSGSVLVHNQSFRGTLVAAIRERYPVEAQVVSTNNSRGVLFWHRWQEPKES